jgi:Na+/H+-dicarboxylate symporter
VAQFSVPLAQALFKPSASIIFCVSALCIASEYNVQITPSWLILCVFISSILAISTPPVPGGGKMAYSALFLQLGIPAEGLVLAMAAEAMLDFLLTAANTYVQMLLIVLISGEIDMLDMTTLISLEYNN